MNGRTLAVSSALLAAALAVGVWTFAENPPQAEQPATTQQPAKVEQPVTTEPGAKSEPPAATEQPAKAEQSVTIEQLATTGQSAAAEHPATPGPAAAEQPSPAAELESAKEAVKTEWPCVWRKTLTLDAATIWDGPPIEDAAKAWQNDDNVRKLSQFLISRRVKAEDADAAVKKFAESQPADVRDQKLTELFAAVLSRTNDDRKVMLDGIERYHKRQLARAAYIEKQGLALPNQGAALPTEPVTGTEIDKVSPEQERYNWDVRVFLERQRNIPLACEIPQLMDERAGEIARAIRGEMKG